MANAAPQLSARELSQDASSHEESDILPSLRKYSANGRLPTKVLINLYLTRIKESSALGKGDEPSAAAVSLLMDYAVRRRDTAALRMLRPYAAEITKRQLDAASLTHTDRPKDLLTKRMDNMLFSLAAQQCNWRDMYIIARATPKGEMTPFMCRAYLQAHSKYARHRKPHEPSALRWCMWLARRIQSELALQLSDMFENGAVKRQIPPWLVDAALTHLSQAGCVYETVRFVNTYLNTMHDTSKGVVRLERDRARLMKNHFIPGHRLLNHVLHACVQSADSRQALFHFCHYTHMPVEGVEPNASFCIEPVNFSLILVLTAMSNEANSEVHVQHMLAFIKHAERLWGLYGKPASSSIPRHIPAHATPTTAPLLIDLRPLSIVLRKALQLESASLVRKIVRYQHGLLTRELRWHERMHRAVPLRDNRNEHAVSERWDTLLQRCVERRYISSAHRLSLRALFKRIAWIHADTRRRS